jgi:hypothetical protein
LMSLGQTILAFWTITALSENPIRLSTAWKNTARHPCTNEFRPYYRIQTPHYSVYGILP